MNIEEHDRIGSVEMKPSPRSRRWRSALATAVSCSAIALCFTSSATAATLQVGDVLDAVQRPSNSDGVPLPGDIYLVRSTGFQSILHYDDVERAFGVGVDPANRIYVLNTPRERIVVCDGNGSVIHSIAGFPDSRRITFDAAGNWYLTAGATFKFYKLDPNGNLVTTYPLTGAVGIDLAADQCTMYFTSDETLGRFDVCRGVRLADVTHSLPGIGYDIRILADGTLLVAAGASAVRLSTNGTILRTYSVLAYSIALAPGGESYWVGPGINRVDVQTGAILEFRSAPSPTYSLAVVGEPRVALVGQAIPLTTPAGLAALAIVLLGIAILRLK